LKSENWEDLWGPALRPTLPDLTKRRFFVNRLKELYQFMVLKNRVTALFVPGAGAERAGSIGWVVPWPQGRAPVSAGGGGAYLSRPSHEDPSAS
jgi:hypothetical protein